jgi:hypothetical protein
MGRAANSRLPGGVLAVQMVLWVELGLLVQVVRV